jgi:hypothetical protein
MQTISVDNVDQIDNTHKSVIQALYIILGFFIIIVLRRYVMDKIAGYLDLKEKVKYSL